MQPGDLDSIWDSLAIGQELYWPILFYNSAVELLQYLDIDKILGLEKSEIARTVIGTSFAWIDLLAYTVGIIMVW